MGCISGRGHLSGTREALHYNSKHPTWSFWNVVSCAETCGAKCDRSEMHFLHDTSTMVDICLIHNRPTIVCVFTFAFYLINTTDRRASWMSETFPIPSRRKQGDLKFKCMESEHFDLCFHFFELSNGEVADRD